MGQYSLYLCLGIWSANCYLLLQKHSLDPRYYGLWLAATLAAAYTHYSAISPIAGMYLLEAITSLYTGAWRRLGWLTLSAIFFVAGVLPLVIFVLPGQLSWAPIREVSLVAFSSGRQVLADALSLLRNTFSFLFIAWPYTYLPEWLPNLLAGLTVGASLLSIKNVSSQVRTWTIWTLISIGLYAALVQLGRGGC